MDLACLKASERNLRVPNSRDDRAMTIVFDDRNLCTAGETQRGYASTEIPSSVQLAYDATCSNRQITQGSQRRGINGKYSMTMTAMS
jgi:hypothetical protein